jgi:hydroxyacylglutathione hydrolase
VLDFLRPLSKNFYFVEGERNGRFPSCHGFLITGSENVLIDAGIGVDRVRTLDKAHRIDILIISHSHPDHIRYWYLLNDRFLLTPTETPDSVCDLMKLGERFTGSVPNGEIWAKQVSEDFGVRAMRHADNRFENNEILEFNGIKLQALHTPGHINDHYCFYDTISGTLLTTDIDLTSFGPWYGNPESNILKFQDSVKKIMEIPATTVCSSHKVYIKGDASAQFQKFLNAFNRQRKMVLELCNGSTLKEMVERSPFYHNGMPNKFLQNVFEFNMISKNLELLKEENIIEEIDGHYTALSLKNV